MAKFSISNLSDIQTLSESVELEFKLAQGQDKQGKLPKDFWPTYSAMANTRGGCVVLGVKENHGRFTPVGIPNPEKVKKDLFDTLNNPSQVNLNILTDKDVETIQIDGLSILIVSIPAATRTQKPIFLKSNPLLGTYARLHEGDRVCSEVEVKRMLAEQTEDSRDNKILSGYDFDDIDVTSLQAYRQLLSVAKPQHPWLEISNLDLLKNLGCWRKDRESEQEGMTLAGVLMFGKWQSIQDAAPNYFVDYQERPEAKAELRWIDRVYPDGTWSGNLFDFYRRTYQKLITDLKIPFELKAGIRSDDTTLHVALREALVNTLVHADYSGRVSVLIVKRPDMFGFRNPGLMRIMPELAIKGGDSDCRNRRIHQMFLMIGAGERAGSGIPKIYSGWKCANWRIPKLWEKRQPEQTLLELSTASLIPEDILQLLRSKFGSAFEELNDFEQIIVTTAATEGWINHERACQLTTLHPREVTLALPRLKTKGFLISSGEKRDKSYSLVGMALPTPEDVFGNILSKDNVITYNDENITHKSQIITHNVENITHKGQSRDKYGRLLSEHLQYPYIDDLNTLNESLRQKLEKIALPAKKSKRLSNIEMQKIIKLLCNRHYIAISELSKLVDRTSQNIRQSQLTPLINEGVIELAFPQARTSKKQGYIYISPTSETYD